MPLFVNVRSFLRNLFLSRRVEVDLDQEVHSHLEMLTEENIRVGMPPKEAHRAARIELGGIEQVKEQVREERIGNWLHSVISDCRYGARQLRKNPGFLTVVVLSLGLGIGANSTIFSVMNALLYRPLPYPHADRMVAIWEIPLAHPDERQPPPIAELLDWQKQNHVFEDIALTSGTESSILSGTSGSEAIRIQDVTPNFFSLLNVKPILGRIFVADEMQELTQTVVISHSFWATHFNSDPGVLGKTFANRNTGIASTVVGVMPPGFAPFYGEPVDLWQPINATSPRYGARQDHWLMPVALLKPGVTLAQAQTEMDVIARRLEQTYPETNKGIGKRLQSLHEALFGWARQPLYPLLGAVAFVLLIACANVANLLQSRTETRRNEYAVRASLGAGRSRLMQQLFMESGLLALLGGALGVLLSYWGIPLFRSLAGEFPSSQSINIDIRVLLFTLAISVLTAFVFGLIPALQASNPDLNNALREGSRRTSSGSRGLTRHALAVCEVALAMVLLIGAGLTINSVLRLQKVDPGFDPRNLLTLRIRLPEGGNYMQRVPGGDMERASPRVTAFYQQLLERIAALPGVESVGSITGLPMHFSEEYSFSILGHPAPSPEQRPRAGYNEVSPGFFRTLKIPLKKGRYLDEHDTAAAPWAVVVNETFAHRFFPNEDPIGQQLLLRYDPYPVDQERSREIVGVVGDVKHFGLEQPAPPFVYASHLQQPTVYPGGAIVAHLWQELAIRTARGARPEDLATAVRKIVADLDSDQSVTNVMTMDQLLAESLGGAKFYMRVLGVFAGIAVLLAVMGIYGVMSYYVNQRTREIGIRVALGAKPVDVLRLVTKLGLKLALLGVVIGIALAVGLARVIATFLFGVKPTDPVTYAAVAMALIAVALLASYIPARRATKVDPMVALRYE
jgi:putative ABC transport system permease protein